MDFARALRHLCTPGLLAARRLPAPAIQAIAAAIRASELEHGGEIRFEIEAALSPSELWHGVTARQRALQVFGEQRVWDTERNTGVLIYLLLADHDVEIVADRGVAAGDWEAVCRAMEAELRAGRYREAALAGVSGVGEVLRRLAPRHEGDRNELPDAPGFVSR
ncbi:MAG TPA: TPM domain-containing protein [Solimonas sp.]|nr:TPM domain-containing protein [Solimonas sp.]